MSIDEKIVKLSQIIDKLEKDDVALTDSLNYFNEGAELVKECYKLLNETKGKVTAIKQNTDAFREENFKI